MMMLVLLLIVLAVLLNNVNSYSSSSSSIKILGVKKSNNVINSYSKSSLSSSSSLHMSIISRSSWSPGVIVKPPRKKILWTALANYLTATSLQWSLIISFMHVLQLSIFDNLSNLNIINNITKRVSFINQDTISTLIVTMFMLFMSVRSRVFSPLDNSRPKAIDNDPVFKNRKRPSWQPAPIAFPIIWSTIALLRTISTVLVFRETGSLLCLPIMSMMAHLSIGDTWNTINNVEQRLGTAFFGVLFVLGSVLATVIKYYETLPLAGKVLAPSAIWLSVATVLVFTIWRLNYESFNFPSLLPSIDEGEVKRWKIPLLKWFSS